MANIAFSVLVTDLFRGTLLGVPDMVFRFVKQGMGRHVRKFRRRMVKERMSGPPGIRGGKMKEKKNKNLKVFVFGRTRQTLVAGATISRFLRAHEEGRTIRPRKGKYLAIKESGEIVALASQVKIPARLGFVDLWKKMEPEGIERIRKDTARGMKVAAQKRRAKIFQIVGRSAV